MNYCRQGHALDGENLYVRPSGANKPRECRKCRSANRAFHYKVNGRRKKSTKPAEVTLQATSPGVVLMTFVDFEDVPIGQGVLHV